MKIVDVRTIPLTWNATNPCMSAGTVIPTAVDP